MIPRKVERTLADGWVLHLYPNGEKRVPVAIWNERPAIVLQDSLTPSNERERIRLLTDERIPEVQRAVLEDELKRAAIEILDDAAATQHDSHEAGRAVSFPSIEPWPEAVDGAALLDELTALVTRYAILPPGAADALALWVLHAHALDAFFFSPVLGITSPGPGCGKTHVLRWLGGVVPRPKIAAHATAPFLFRLIEVQRPTMLIDEADCFLGESEKLRGLINSGYARDGTFGLTMGDDHEPREFSTFCPKAIAGIGELHQTITERAILIEMVKKTREERVARMRERRFLAECEPIRRRAVRWAADHRDALEAAEPECPEVLDDRQQQHWEPLFAIADAAGGTWPGRARHAACLLCQVVNEHAESVGEQLLSDIRDLFDESGADELSTEAILAGLHRLSERPWPTWHKGKPMDPRGLGSQLKKFKIRSATLHRRDEKDAKGYKRSALDDAFSRYLRNRVAVAVDSERTDADVEFIRPADGCEARNSLSDKDGRGGRIETGNPACPDALSPAEEQAAIEAYARRAR